MEQIRKEAGQLWRVLAAGKSRGIQDRGYAYFLVDCLAESQPMNFAF
ncbi:MAG: hypothetical protein AVDCRST_MAG01-01-2759 [uncultured Rubrobacteraceae bacterium]|uniref:Uncharacterized protein n=1 Tax=uncultured Rubrobacteraceae bacterium TaxID=349277 RepID=A0A6J4Q5Y0_9ACTN|nr:MAG: hypothetical protein AVDCRST_MAG01-01-2759 [uncultured Rubrobacteraceae bacterium]